MKNIILIGAGRTGKTTFAKMIKSKYKEYNLLHGDMIKKSFQSFTNIDGNTLKNDPNYRKFVKDLFYNHINLENENYIIDTVDIYPADITTEDRKNTIIIAFGCTKHTKEELLNIWKNKDNKWLKNKTDEYLLQKAERAIAKSKFYEEECKKCDIEYIDTSYDRELLLEKLLLDLDDRIK